MTLIDILLVLLIIAAVALCVYLIISLSKINKSVEVLQKDVAVPEVVFIALSHKTYIVSMD